MDLSAPLAPGWARATCSGPVKASLLYRQHNSEGAPTAEAGVNAAAVPATRFVTFAEQGEGQFGTGVAYANPSDTSATVTFTARDAAGEVLASVDRTLLPGGHDAHGMGALFGPTSFTGSIEVTSTEPIVSLSLNFEADPVFSSLPPGNWMLPRRDRLRITSLTCRGSELANHDYLYQLLPGGGELAKPISSPITELADGFVCGTGNGCQPTRRSAARGSVHQETNVDLNASLAPGWARATCSGR